jgi:hypothetical protein
MSYLLWSMILAEQEQNLQIWNQLNADSTVPVDDAEPRVKSDAGQRYFSPRKLRKKSRGNRTSKGDTFRVDENSPLPFEQLDAASCTPEGQRSLRERITMQESILQARQQHEPNSLEALMMANSDANGMAESNRIFLLRTLRSCDFYFGEEANSNERR